MTKILLAEIEKPYKKVNRIVRFACLYALSIEVENYEGPLITVMELDGNTEKDIYADKYGFLDIESLLAHCNEEDGVVTKIYCQHLYSDLVGAGPGNYPRIVNAGVLITENGQPAIEFDNNSDFMTALIPYADDESVVSMALLWTKTVADESDVMISTNTGRGVEIRNLANNRTRIDTRRTAVTTCNSTNDIDNDETVCISLVTDRSNVKLYENGELITTVSDDNTDFESSANITLGGRGSGADHSSGRFQFFGVALEDATDNMPELYTELSQRYGIDTDFDTTIDVGSETYVTGTTGDKANTEFRGDIMDRISIEKEIGFFVHGNESDTKISNLVFANDGRYDYLIDAPMLNQLVKLKIVERGAAYSTAIQIGEFIIGQFKSNNDDTEIIADLLPKMSLLDKNTIHSYYPDNLNFANNQNQPQALAIGNVYSVPIKLLHATENRYELTSEPTVFNVLAVSDRGDDFIPVTDYAEVTNGETGGFGIDLVSPPSGTITANYVADDYSVINSKVFQGFVGKAMVTFGGFDPDDIDFDSAEDIDQDLDYRYGLYIEDGTNIKSIIESACASHCGFYFENNQGKVVFDVLKEPSITADHEFTTNDLASGVDVSIDLAPGLSDSVASRKNWHVFSYEDVRDIGGMSEETKQTLSSDFRFKVRSETTRNGQGTFHPVYSHARNGDYIQSLLTNESSAEGLTAQLADLYSDIRRNYEFDVLTDDIFGRGSIQLNDTIKLTHNRYSLDDGKNMRVMYLRIADVQENLLELRGWG